MVNACTFFQVHTYVRPQSALLKKKKNHPEEAVTACKWHNKSYYGLTIGRVGDKKERKKEAQVKGIV